MHAHSLTHCVYTLQVSTQLVQVHHQQQQKAYHVIFSIAQRIPAIFGDLSIVIFQCE